MRCSRHYLRCCLSWLFAGQISPIYTSLPHAIRFSPTQTNMSLHLPPSTWLPLPTSIAHTIRPSRRYIWMCRWALLFLLRLFSLSLCGAPGQSALQRCDPIRGYGPVAIKGESGDITQNFIAAACRPSSPSPSCRPRPESERHAQCWRAHCGLDPVILQAPTLQEGGGSGARKMTSSSTFWSLHF